MTTNNYITATVFQHTFHGPCQMPIRGRNWRAWNLEMIAVDMDLRDVTAMIDSVRCPYSDCVCGGGYLPDMADNSQYGRRVQTWLVPTSWLADCDDATIQAAIDQCDTWIDEYLTQGA